MIMQFFFSKFRLLFEALRPRKRTSLSEVSLLPEIFHWKDPKSLASFIFQPDFPETCKW